jgi:AcrR family transcriptional regulator
MARPNVSSKEDLIEAAKVCLVKNGMEKFTLRAVAEQAGVTQGTVYYHFRTKEQLLLEIVRKTCETSWMAIADSDDEQVVQRALDQARSRCSSDSFYHRLFFTLMVSGFQHETIRRQLGEILERENETLSKQLSAFWTASPFKGVSLDSWAIFLNALIDGLAIQALLSADFDVESVYAELEQLLDGLNGLTGKEQV